MFQVGVKALITDQKDRVLVLKVEGNRYNKNVVHWDIPGGRIEQGSDAAKTLKRELKEEIGVDKIVKSGFFTSVISKHEFVIESGHNVGLVLMIYEVSIPKDSKVTLSDEHTAYEWVSKKVATKRLTNKYPAEFTELLK